MNEIANDAVVVDARGSVDDGVGTNRGLGLDDASSEDGSRQLAKGATLESRPERSFRSRTKGAAAFVSLLESISAITLVVADMARSVAFYEALGFERLYGGEDADFTSYRVGGGYLNLAQGDVPEGVRGWGRSIFYVADVDAMHALALRAGCRPEFAPRDARWGERYFHLRDPDGHELSFARPLEGREEGER